MKQQLLFLSFLFLNTSFCFSQLPQTYPYKAISDVTGGMFVAGDKYNQNTQTLEYSVIGIPLNDDIWVYTYDNSSGNDRAMDIILVNDNNFVFVYATGFIINEENKMEILTTKLTTNGGLIWQKKYSVEGEDCKALAITSDASFNPFVTGYVTLNGIKSILTLKFDNYDGTLLNTYTYSNPAFSGDNVGTSIMADAGNVYVLGYTYNGPVNKNDIIMLSYGTNGDADTNIYQLANDQMPTAFKFAELSRVTSHKSRVVVTSVSDLIGVNPNRSTEFFTVYYDGGVKNSLLWARSFYRPKSYENVPTSLDVDRNGNVYLAGYTKTKNSGYDFTTLKYLANGSYGWTDTVKYFDELQGNDKASSIRIHGRNIFITGPCERTPGSYKTVAYSQTGINNTEILWTSSFTPSFMDIRTGGLERAALLCLDTVNGVLSTFTMQWGNNEDSPSKFAIQSYDLDGNTISTYDDNDNSGSDALRQTENRIDQADRISSRNFPNPFNPSTIIKFNVPADGMVKVKVYDIAGKEIAVLANGFMNKGDQELEFNSSNYPGLTSGIYFYKIESGKFSEVRKMLLVK